MKISKFQVIVLSLFVLFIVVGVAAFATYRGSSSTANLPPITVWGTFPKDQFDAYVAKVNLGVAQQLTVTYVQESEGSFLNDFISALARGAGPDAVLIPADMLLSTEDKLTPIPYSILPQALFAQSYIDEARVYLGADGAIGVPFAVDPLVMYWNRDMFDAAGIALPPRAWEDLAAASKKITVKDQNGTVSVAGAALGDFTNVDNAREIFGTMLLQLGNPVTKRYGPADVRSELRPSGSTSPIPAISYFTGFVNPANPSYSWNRSWPESRTAFLSGKLAIYFGFASELFGMRDRNPNLPFDVSPVPQWKTGGTPAVYGKLYGFSITKASPNANAAYQAIYDLTLPANLAQLSADTYLPSVSRQVIAAGTSDAYLTTFNQQALVARTWLDADPQASSRLMGDMITSVTSGQKSAYEAVSDFDNQYDAALRSAFGQ